MYGGDSGGVFAGNGFMPSQFGGDGMSPAPSSKKVSSQSTLRAITIKQLFDGTSQTVDDQYEVDGAKLETVTLVGKVVSLAEQQLQLTLQIDDGTGVVDVKYWIEDNNDAAEQQRSEWRVGTYVRLHGNLRSFDNQRSIVAYHMRPVADFNEITYHNLQCVFQHLHLTKGAAAAATAAATTPGGAAAMPTAVGGGSGIFGGGMDGVQQEVNNVLKSEHAQASASGVSTEEIVSRLGGNFTIGQVRNALDFLVNEGHAYTAVDDNHFKSTDC